MAQINPQQLLQAAMASNPGAGLGAPTDTGGPAGGAQATPAGAAATAAQGLPGGQPGAQPIGASPQGADTGNPDLSALLGSGTDLSQDPAAMQSMMAMLQDPSTPPDQKALIQQRLQLAALASLAQNPTGSPQAQANGA